MANNEITLTIAKCNLGDYNEEDIIDYVHAVEDELVEQYDDIDVDINVDTSSFIFKDEVDIEGFPLRIDNGFSIKESVLQIAQDVWNDGNW